MTFRGSNSEERNMSRKTRVLTLALGGICCFGVSKASAQFLDGNVWPNSDLSIPAPPGPDYNNNPAIGDVGDAYPGAPLGSGDTNPRPLGWHRGGVDFGTQAAPEMTFWNPVEGTLPPGGPANALEIDDNDLLNYGEWFSNYVPLPAASVNGANPVFIRFEWEYTNVASTARPENSDQFRVSARWGTAGQTLYTGDLGGAPDNPIPNGALIPAGSPDQTSWQTVTEEFTPVAGAQTMEITIDSGGSSAATGQIWVGDISVSSVPEPTSLGLLSAGALLLAKRRRRA
jgi:hypothetical protein